MVALISFHRHGHGVASTEAKRSDSTFYIAAVHFVNQSDEHASAAGSNGMADGDRATIDVNFVEIEPEFANHTQGLNRESFVEFV